MQAGSDSKDFSYSVCTHVTQLEKQHLSFYTVIIKGLPKPQCLLTC